MPGSVARLPQTPSGGDGIPPADVYKVAVEEYRFQAQYNWSRTQYLLGFNAAILAAAFALVERSRGAALVFLVGLCAAVLSAAVVRQQHGYYRAARDHMRRVEDRYHLPDEERLDTTSTLGGRTRFVSVNQVVYLLLGLIGSADLVGTVLALTR